MDGLDSWGRYPDGAAYFQSLPITKNASNLEHYNLFIEEVVLAGEDFEYIKITNPTSDPINLMVTNINNQSWRLNGADDYYFPAGCVVAPLGKKILVIIKMK